MSKLQEEVLEAVERCESVRRKILAEISTFPFDNWYARTPYPDQPGRSLIGVWMLSTKGEDHHPVAQTKRILGGLFPLVEDLQTWASAFNELRDIYDSMSHALWRFSLTAGEDSKIYEEAAGFQALNNDLYECIGLLERGIPEKLFASWAESRLPKHFVAVGSNGTKPVVWGYGPSSDEALEDAALWCEPNLELDTHRITVEQAAMISEGNINWPLE